MKKHLLYVIGQPGSGKSTLVRAALTGIQPRETPTKPVAHSVYNRSAIQLGAQRTAFSGTDALSLSCQPLVIRWLLWDKFPYTHVLAEGDRLANDGFFTMLHENGWDVTVVLLNTPDIVAAERRAGRGSQQNETWIKGRQSKVVYLDAKWVRSAWRLDGTQPVEFLAQRLRQHPVIEACRRVALFKTA